MDEIEPRRPLDDRKVGTAVPHQRHAKHHGVGRAVGGAQWQKQRSHVHVAERLPLLHLDQPHLLGQRLERIVGIGQPRDRLAVDLALVAGEAAHRPRAR